MSSRKKAGHALQVFPFLAVLVCTMGALIFLLLLMTRQVKHREMAFAAHRKVQREMALAAAAAMQSASVPDQSPLAAEPVEEPQIIVIPALPAPEMAAPKPAKKVKLPNQAHVLAVSERERELQQLTKEWKLKTKQLKVDREKIREALEKRQAVVDSAVAQVSAIESQVDQLSGKLEHVAGEAEAAIENTPDDAERLVIEQQIFEMKKRLKAAQAADSNGQNDQYQVVPFDPQTGTTRRPILLECSAAGIRFLPEGITISPGDFTGFTPKANPLGAGTGALINYWNEWNSKQKNPRSQPEPYPLLLVRPDGVIAYYVAIKMLEPIRTTHGYELIEEGTVLKLPDVDEGAREALKVAVERMLAERQTISQQAARSGAGTSVFGGSGGGNGRGGKGSGRGGGNGSGTGPGSGPGNSRAGGTGGPGSKGGSGGAGGGDGEADAFAEGRPRGGRGTGSGGDGDGAGEGFSLDDLEPKKEGVGSHSWENVENFSGRRGGKAGGSTDDGTSPPVGGSASGSRRSRTGDRIGMTPPDSRQGGGGGGSSGGGSSGGDGTEAGVEGGGLSSPDAVFGDSSGGGGGSGSGGSSGGGQSGGAGQAGGSGKQRGAGQRGSGAPSGGARSQGGAGSQDGGGKDSAGSQNDAGKDGSGSESDTGQDGAEQGGNTEQEGGSGQQSGAGSPSGGSGRKGSLRGPGSRGASGGRQTANSESAQGSKSSGDESAQENADGSQSANADDSRARADVPVDQQERWSSDGGASRKKEKLPPTSYAITEPGMPIGQRPGQKNKKKNSSDDGGPIDYTSVVDDKDDKEDDESEDEKPPAGAQAGRAGSASSYDQNPALTSSSRIQRTSSNSPRPPHSRRQTPEEAQQPIQPERLTGRHWGYSEANSSIGFERDVRCEVMPDKLLIAGRHEIPLDGGMSRDDTFELVVMALDRCSHEWGRPPQGFFWTPRMKFVVRPEATSQYEMINSMMTRAGLSTTHEFAKTKNSVEFGRDGELSKTPAAKTGRKTSVGGGR